MFSQTTVIWTNVTKLLQAFQKSIPRRDNYWMKSMYKLMIFRSTEELYAMRRVTMRGNCIMWGNRLGFSNLVLWRSLTRKTERSALPVVLYHVSGETKA